MKTIAIATMMVVGLTTASFAADKKAKAAAGTETADAATAKPKKAKKAKRAHDGAAAATTPAK